VIKVRTALHNGARETVLRTLIRCLFIAVAVSNAAQAQEIVKFTGGDFNEEFRESAQVSGSLVVGVLAAGLQDGTGSLVSTRVPKDWGGGSVCVSVISSDGLYNARNAYQIGKEWAGKNAEIEHDTDYTEELRTMSSDKVAVRVWSGDCENEKTEYTPALWNTLPSAKIAELKLLINSFRADEVYLYPSPDAIEPISCSRIEDDGHTAFDARCTVSSEYLGDGVLDMEVVNIRNRELDPPLSIRVLLDAEE
jgi:hypothetical protein